MSWQALCRKLQKENKRVLEASQQLAKTEASARAAARAELDTTLASISAKCVLAAQCRH